MAVSKTLMRKGFMLGARYSGLTHLVAPILRGNGAVLMLHRVGKQQSQSGINNFLSVEGGFLHALLGELKEAGHIFVTLDEAFDRIKAGHSDEHFLTVTLDDGYRDNMLTAAPIFESHDVPFTIYACSGFSDGNAFLWWEIIADILDKNSNVEFVTPEGIKKLTCSTAAQKNASYVELIEYLCHKVDEFTQRQLVRDFAAAYRMDVDAHCRHAIMSWGELKKVSENPLCTIGAHTLNHYHLARLPYDDAVTEIAGSALRLEEQLGIKPTHFAYPYGGKIASGPREAQIAKDAGYSSAVTTRHGLLQPSHKENLFTLPRISINGEYQRTHYVKTMLSGITVPVANRGRRFVTI